MNLAGLQEGDTAGIVSLGTEYAAMAVARKDGAYVVKQITGVQDFDCDTSYADEKCKCSVISEKEFTDADKSVYFRYTVICTGYVDQVESEVPVKHVPTETITMEISFDGKNYRDAFMIEAKAGRWVGVKNGMFCVHDNTVKTDSSGYATAEYVKYEG
jgi:hypothetical protein